MQRESSKVVVSAHGERESGTQINPRWNRASSPGKNNAGDDISTLTFKGASRSTNWVISGNIKALFLWDLKEKNVITSSTKHESFQYPSFLSPGNEKRFTLKRHFLWLHVLEPHKCKPSPPAFFWRKRGLQSFLLITVHLNKGRESHLFYQPHCLTCQ